ncbi:MAG: ABC transporter ATP-binding protein [candidate division KSB1 bacterium]|nr:ABC transporter ATP-binding protein [candidate division KSB1 bacterium]
MKPVYAIQAWNLRKSFGASTALAGIDVQVRKGELFGLIGPDGAGKTTLIRTLCGLLAPDSGHVEILGHDVYRSGRSIREIVGYMPQHFSLYQDLSVEQNLRFFGELYGVPRHELEERLEELYRFSRLKAFRHRRAGALSGGMKQKLALSCALINRPPVLLLDEPTYGVDPISRQELWQILLSLRGTGTTVLVSTAYMEEADYCDRVGLLHQGRIVRVGAPRELRASYPLNLYRVRCADLPSARRFLEETASAVTVHAFGDSLHVGFPKTMPMPAWREPRDLALEWEPIAPSIEDVFLYEMERQSAEHRLASGEEGSAAD